ncbi:MAG: hypothetical protein IJ751_07905 [Oscillospiraceae bacterium]|nr:hypothetical protein [Oscillospiraceae bacterium]
MSPLYIIGVILLLGLPSLLAVLFIDLAPYKRWASRNRETQIARATLTRKAYEDRAMGRYQPSYTQGTQLNPAKVWFRMEWEKRPRCFETQARFITALPEEGTAGTLVCKGKIFYSFQWAGGKVEQEQPE